MQLGIWGTGTLCLTDCEVQRNEKKSRAAEGIAYLLPFGIGHANALDPQPSTAIEFSEK